MICYIKLLSKQYPSAFRLGMMNNKYHDNINYIKSLALFHKFNRTLVPIKRDAN